MTNKLTELVKKIEDLRETMKREGQYALKEVFVDFFDKHPEADSIVWVQYTPYFNDGDACIFSKYESELKVDPDKMAPDVAKLLGFDADSDENEDDYSDDYSYSYGDACAASVLTSLSDTGERSWGLCTRKGVPHRELTASEQSLVDDFNELDSNLQKSEELLQEVLGDHCMVRATRDGFDITEYDHD